MSAPNPILGPPPYSSPINSPSWIEWFKQLYVRVGLQNAPSNLTALTNPMTTLGDTLYQATPPNIGTVTGNKSTTKKFYSQTGTGTVSAAPSWSTIATGDLPTIPVTAGGTGAVTASAGFNALSPMTTGGDIIYGAASGAGTRLANGTSGQVLTSNGGTTAPSWQSSGLSNVAYIREEQAQNTAAGTFTANTWLTRTLNTKTDPNSIITTLASNQFTIPSGTYKIEASAPASGNTNNHQAKLYNITDSADQLIGTSEYNFNNSSATRSFVVGVFTIAASKVFEIRHYSNGGSPGTLGQVANITTEVYTQVVLMKLA